MLLLPKPFGFATKKCAETLNFCNYMPKGRKTNSWELAVKISFGGIIFYKFNDFEPFF